MAAVQFLLNGEVRAEADVSPTTTVLDWLRTRARLTGTKEGCAEGDCGACTIALRRPGAERFQAVNSCLMLLAQLDGCDVLTIEGLSAPDAPLHPVQQALLDADATQCGFCTPGFAMAMFAFGESGESADDDHIHEALAGNLCRCTGYRSIVDACRKVASGSVLDDGMDRHPEAAPPQRSLNDELPRPLPFETRLRQAPQGDGTEFVHGAQTFHAPTSLDQLVDLRAAHPDAILLAGGTDLGLKVSKEREQFARTIATAGVAELRQVRAEADALVIGGAATYSQALPIIDERFPAFGALIRRIGSRQIRNLGTFAGNLATASPIGDTLPCLIALDAEVIVCSRRGTRTLKVDDFITGYRQTDLAPDEIIAAIRIPYLPAGAAFAAYKVSKRFDQDISTVVAAFRLTCAEGTVQELRAAYGGMAARCKRARALEEALIGQPWKEAALARIDALLAQEFSPLTDHRGGSAYRLRAASGLVRRFLIETTSTGALARVEAL